MNPVDGLEQELLSKFTEFAEFLNKRFPDVKARAYSVSVGSRTKYQGHDIVVDCLLTKASSDQSDNVALCINLKHIYTDPMISADVCWGHPSGHIEAEFSSQSLAVSDHVLNNLYADIPRLQESLIEAIKRGKPGA